MNKFMIFNDLEMVVSKFCDNHNFFDIISENKGPIRYLMTIEDFLVFWSKIQDQTVVIPFSENDFQSYFRTFSIITYFYLVLAFK